MNRNAFMAELRRGLRGLPETTMADIIADYEGHFAEGIAAGRSEDAVAMALGDPARLARELRAEAGFKRWEETRSPENFAGAIVALLGLLTLDAIFVLPILIGIGAAIFGFAICFVVFVCVGFVFLAGPLFQLDIPGGNVASVLFGIGFIAGGVAGSALLIMVVNGLIWLLVKYARLHYRLLEPSSTNQGA
jgi:uncharacterized membrane protein